jgi:hypothetical protein
MLAGLELRMAGMSQHSHAGEDVPPGARTVVNLLPPRHVGTPGPEPVIEVGAYVCLWLRWKWIYRVGGSGYTGAILRPGTVEPCLLVSVTALALSERGLTASHWPSSRCRTSPDSSWQNNLENLPEDN